VTLGASAPKSFRNIAVGQLALRVSDFYSFLTSWKNSYIRFLNRFEMSPV
jgi:hypothetical protein